MPDPEQIRGKRVLVIEDGPTTTHGGMPFGAGILAATEHGASEFVDPRPWATGEIAETFEQYPDIGDLGSIQPVDELSGQVTAPQLFNTTVKMGTKEQPGVKIEDGSWSVDALGIQPLFIGTCSRPFRLDLVVRNHASGFEIDQKDPAGLQAAIHAVRADWSSGVPKEIEGSDFEMPAQDIYAVWPERRYMPAKVRLFMYLQFIWGFHHVLDWCIFTTVPEFRAAKIYPGCRERSELVPSCLSKRLSHCFLKGWFHENNL